MSQITTFGRAVSNYKEEECPLCLEVFTDETRVQVLACQHIFHPDCIKEADRDSCSLCNRLISPVTHNAELALGFYAFLFRFIKLRLPYDTGSWEPESLDFFSIELEHAVQENPEWNRFLAIKGFKDLVERYDPEHPSVNEEDPNIIWQEALFREFKNHPRIKPLFAEIAKRYLAIHDAKILTMSLWGRLMILTRRSAEEAEALEKARKICSTERKPNPAWNMYFATFNDSSLSESL